MATRRRSYVSPVRAAAAVEKRARVLAAAGQLLREQAIGEFSLEAVAKAAGVTRLTVYNQFGCRRGLFEALFDERARQGGLAGIAAAMAMEDPRAALDRVVEVLCDFWSMDPALGRLHDAMVLDVEFAQALARRNERRRKLLEVLAARLMTSDRESGIDRQGAVDLMFGLTSHAMFRMLSRGDRGTGEVCKLLQSACRAACAPVPDAGSRIS